MSTKESTPEGPPLDPHTLRVVIELLNQRLATPQPVERLTTVDALEGVRDVVQHLLAATSDRARVVVLPEADEVSEDGTQAAWKRRGWGGYYVMADSELGQLSQAGHGTPECASARALAILAAAEFAGGAQ